MRLYKIPGAYVYGVFGSFGSGKSLFLVENALEFACYHKKQIASNFYLNVKFIRQYGIRYNKPWLTFCRIRHSLKFDELLSQENSILILDEAGIEIFARDWRSTKKSQLDSLFRIRHYRNKLIYAAQDWTQVEISFRRMTHLCIWLKGFQYYPASDDPQLISRFSIYFDTAKFDNFINDTGKKTKLIYPLVISGFRFDFARILGSIKYKYLFACYNSFDSDRSRKTYRHRHEFIEYDENKVFVGNRKFNTKTSLNVDSSFDLFS